MVYFVKAVHAQFGVTMTVISMFLKIFLDLSSDFCWNFHAAGIALLANVTFNFAESITYRSRGPNNYLTTDHEGPETQTLGFFFLFFFFFFFFFDF